MIYDIIAGLKLSKNHCSTLYFSREELEDTIGTAEMYRKLHQALNEALSTTEDIPDREDILDALQVIQEHLYKGVDAEVSEDDLDVVKEAFDVISYYGVDAYLLRRDDLGDVNSEPRAVRAYIIVTQPLEDRHSRLSSALGISSTDITMGSTSDLVMETFRSKIRIEPSLESIINLNTQINNWELMSDIGAGYEYDSSNLLDLLENLGYKLKVFLTR